MDTDQVPAPSGEVHPFLKIGEVLGGRFDILKPLGSGGMAHVYLARDGILGREMALKVYPKAGLKSAALERIRREVAVARDLRHPGLVRYYDLHETEEFLALSMECVRGGTLQDRIQRVWEEALISVLPPLVEALDHLHTHGIIHRDVKPSNIFLPDDGAVKLGDFGIIHVEDEKGITRTGETVGTPTHMSPEQFQGSELTAASDYYSLGVTLYEALTGAPPFMGTYGELAVQHMSHPPPVIPARAATRRMRRLVEGLLLKDPRRRWGKPELDRFLHSSRLPFLPRQKKTAAFLAAALVLAAISPIAWGRYHHPEPTSIQTHPPKVAAYRGDRLLWEKDIPGLTDAVLADTDGDGLKEVVVGKALELKKKQEGVRLEVLGKDGAPRAPMQLGKNFGHVFPGFAPSFQTFFAPVDSRRFAVFFFNPNFYPTYAYIWDAPSRSVVFSVIHSGRFYSAVPFGKGVAMEGINNRLLHQKVLLVTQDLAAATPLSYNAVDDINYLYGKGARAYYLLGSEGKIRLDGPDSVWARVPGEPEHRLRPNAAFEGMASGAASLSLEYIEAYRQIRDLLMQGGAAQAIPRLDKLLQESERAALYGDTVLFASLKAESLLRLGRGDEAAATAQAWADKYPGYGTDLLIQAAMGLLANANASGAVRILKGVSNESFGGRREEIRTVLIWASILESPEKGLKVQEFEGDLIPAGPYWKPYAQMQAGWIHLLNKDPKKAGEILAPSLGQDGMENHAAGYFMAKLAAHAFDASEFDAYLKRARISPPYLLWLGALGRGDSAEASRQWTLLKEDAHHTPDSALMLVLLNRVKTIYKL